MRAFLKWWIEHPPAMILVVVAVAFWGGYGVQHMSVDIFPRMDVPVVNIITHDPGVSPEDIERLISRPVEDSLRGVPGVSRVASTSGQGLSQVTAQFTWGTSVRDARQLVQSQLAQLRGRLPAGVVPRLENIETTLHEVCGYVLYGGEDAIALRNAAVYDLSARLMGIPGVASVEVLGGERHAFYITLDPAAMIRIGLTVGDVVDALRRSNITAEAGILNRFGREYFVRGDARFQTLDDLRLLPVRETGETPVLLEDVADLQEGFAPRHYTVHGDGVSAVAVVIRKQPGANTLRVAQDVDASLSKSADILPPETQVKKFYDQSEIILQARDEIIRDLLIGALLAVGVLYFFLGAFRPTLIVALTIPVTFLAVLGMMSILGLSLNVITMTALALAVGLIVDDAIVVAENIFRHAASGSHARSAALEGTAEIAAADVSGTFTTVAAFLPLILVGGLAAVFMRSFGVTISIALLVSLLLALSWVPMLFGRLNLVAVHKTKAFAGARLLLRMTGVLQSVLRFAFRRKIAVIVLVILSLGLAGVSVFFDRIGVLPPIDEGALLIEYILPPGTSLEESDRLGERFEQIALNQPDVSCVYRRTGSPGDSYLIEGVNRGELVIKLKSGRRRDAEEITAELRRAFSGQAGVSFLYHQPTQEKIDESFSGLPALFGVTLYGPDASQLTQLSKQVETLMEQDSSVADIVNSARFRVPQINVQLDRIRLAQVGVEPQVALDTLRAALKGIECTSIVREKEVVGVWVRTDGAPDPSVEELSQTPVATRSGGWVPLSHVADISIRNVPSFISRLNGRREVTILAEVNGSIPSAVQRLRQRFASLDLPAGCSIDFTGQYKTLIETAKEMAWVVAAAMVLICFIMIMQFHSWRQPLIILVTVPLSLVGALLGLYLTRQGIDVSVGIGAVTLVGIAVNNAIVLMDFFNRERTAGKSVEKALLSAASVRLRPILMTTFTTIAALLPAAAGLTIGAKTFQPFAVTIISGLIGGVFATLIVVPTLTAAVYSRSKDSTAS